MHAPADVRLAPILGTDLGEVGAFLHDHLNPRVSARAWAAAILPTWRVGSPNHGFLLRDDSRGQQVVGVQLAFYSRRRVDGRFERFCNLGAWCVLEDYRSQGLRLLRAALAQRDYHFTDLSPSGSVVDINTRLRFQRLDTTTAVVPAVAPAVLPLLTTAWGRRPRLPARAGAAAARPEARPGAPAEARPEGRPDAKGVRVESDPAVVESLLSGADLQIFHDHRRAAATLHLVLVDGDETAYVVLRRDRRHGLPLFASVLHAGDPDLVRRHAVVLARHLLTRHGVPFVLVELRRIDGPPVGGIVLRSSRPKMYRSTLPAGAIDDLYSELALVAW